MEKEKQEKALEAVSGVSERKIDENEAQTALQTLTDSANNTQERTRIQIREEDIKIIVAEMQVARKEAERALILHNGELLGALAQLIEN